MLLSLGQRMLNEQIAVSTAARERVAGLEGKRFAVAVRGSDLRIIIEVSAGQLRLETSQEGDCDVELTAGALDLLQLARSAGLSDLRAAGAVLNGDLQVAEAFADLIRHALPEPEAMLADWIGDMPAHALSDAARRFGGFSRRVERAFEQNLSEYLQEESPTLTPPALARRFGAEVERIRDGVERAERRIELLERRRRSGKS